MNNKPSFVEEARRKQILDIALDKIAIEGYENTTIQEIAKEANISKGVIYYHFKGKQELIVNIWKVLFEDLFEYRKARVETQKTAIRKLKVYLESNIEFIKDNYNKIVALYKVGISLGSDESSFSPWHYEAYERCFKYLSEILAEGQKMEEFRDFSPKAMASVIQSAFEGLCMQWIAVPGLFDLEISQKLLLEMMETSILKGNK